MINCILVNRMYDICVMHAIYILTKILLLLYFKKTIKIAFGYRN